MTRIAMDRHTEAASYPAAIDDEELVARVQAGDTAAFDHIVSRYKDRVYSYACRMLGDPETAGEAAQDVFLRAFRYMDRFRGDAKFSTWFYTIVTSTCKNAAAYHGYRAKRREASAPNAENGAAPDPVDRVPDLSMAPETLVERLDTRRAVRRAIESLPELYRQAIVLKDINDMSYEEMTRILNCRLGTVKSRLARARAMLREKLTGTGLFGAECD